MSELELIWVYMIYEYESLQQHFYFRYSWTAPVMRLLTMFSRFHDPGSMTSLFLNKVTRANEQGVINPRACSGRDAANNNETDAALSQGTNELQDIKVCVNI